MHALLDSKLQICNNYFSGTPLKNLLSPPRKLFEPPSNSKDDWKICQLDNFSFQNQNVTAIKKAQKKTQLVIQRQDNVTANVTLKGLNVILAKLVTMAFLSVMVINVIT